MVMFLRSMTSIVFLYLDLRLWMYKMGRFWDKMTSSLKPPFWWVYSSLSFLPISFLKLPYVGKVEWMHMQDKRGLLSCAWEVRGLWRNHVHLWEPQKHVIMKPLVMMIRWWYGRAVTKVYLTLKNEYFVTNFTPSNACDCKVFVLVYFVLLVFKGMNMHVFGWSHVHLFFLWPRKDVMGFFSLLMFLD